MTESLATLREDRYGDVPVMAIDGEVDTSNAAAIGGALRGVVANTAHVLVVDLRRTTYLDSAGINLLFALGGEMQSRQQSLRLVVGDGSPIARMLAITGLDRAFPALPTVEAALAA